MEIELGAGGHMRREDFRIDGEVEHGEVTPVRGQKRLQHRLRRNVEARSMERGVSKTTRLRTTRQRDGGGSRLRARLRRAREDRGQRSEDKEAWSMELATANSSFGEQGVRS